MKRLVLLSVVLLAGCSSFRGPFESKPGKADDPLFSLQEQEKRGRAYYSLPQDSPTLAPDTQINRYGSTATGP